MISNLVIQFPDVGEIPTITTPSQLYPGIKEDGSILCSDLADPKLPPFLFTVTAQKRNTVDNKISPLGSSREQFIRSLGFVSISSMANWSSYHNPTHSKLTFWWLRLRERYPTAEKMWLTTYPVQRTSWCSSKDLAKGGCGYKLGEPPLSRAKFYRFFTMLRMPPIVGPQHLKKLVDWNYRMFDSSPEASFWINGWDPDVWDWDKVEKPFWEERKVSLVSTQPIK